MRSGSAVIRPRQRHRPAEVIVSLPGPHPDTASAIQRQAAARALELADSGRRGPGGGRDRPGRHGGGRPLAVDGALGHGS